MTFKIVILSLFGVFLLVSSYEEDAKPGAAVQFTRKGLSYAAQLTFNSAKKWILQAEHKTQGRMIFPYTLSNISVSGLDSVKNDVIVEEESELSWQMNNVDFALTSAFKMKLWGYDLLGAELHINVTNTSLYLPITFGTNGKGQPTLKSTCQFNDTGDWSIQFTGEGKGVWILNCLLRTYKSYIIRSIKSKICLAISTSLNKAADKSFSKYQDIVVVGSKFSANYSVSESVLYNYSSVIFPMLGELFWTKERTASSFTAPDLPPLTRKDQMLYFVLTDYVFNSLAFAAFHQKQLDKTVTNKDLPEDQSFFLNTTCPGHTCLGKLIAQTATRFPNGQAELQIKSSERPQMVISPGSVSISFNANIQFYVNTPQKTGIYMFSIKTRLDTLLHVLTNEISQSGRVTAVIKSTSLSVGILDSSIGAINLSLLNTLVNTIVDIYVTPQLNGLGAKGIPLPNLGKNLQLKGPKLYIVKDAIIVGTDVNYKKDTTRNLMFQKVDKQNAFQVVFNNNNKKPMIL